MGAANSTQIDTIDQNILNQIKNKDYSVVSINENPGFFNDQGNIIVSVLEGDGKCRRLPKSAILKPNNTINKNIFVTGKKHMHFYANKKCTIRANEEAYAVVKKPIADLFSPNLDNTNLVDPDTSFTFVPFKDYQNAYYYKINDKPTNTPRLPQFYIKNKDADYNTYLNKQFVEFDDDKDDTYIGNSLCREIPTVNPADPGDITPTSSKLDYHFLPKESDAKLSSSYGRETGIDRFPDENNTISNAPGVKYQPINIYTDVVKDINNNPILNENGDLRCTNIYTDSTKSPFPGRKLGGDKLSKGYHTFPTANERFRYTPLPYTTVKNYGTVLAEKSNSLYYALKNEEGILD